MEDTPRMVEQTVWYTWDHCLGRQKDERYFNHMAVAQRTGTNMEPWYVETWTKTCVTFNFEPHPHGKS